MEYWSIGKETAALIVYSIRVPLNDLRLRILIAVAVLALLIVEQGTMSPRRRWLEP